MPDWQHLERRDSVWDAWISLATNSPSHVQHGADPDDPVEVCPMP